MQAWAPSSFKRRADKIYINVTGITELSIGLYANAKKFLCTYVKRFFSINNRVETGSLKLEQSHNPKRRAEHAERREIVQGVYALVHFKERVLGVHVKRVVVH